MMAPVAIQEAAAAPPDREQLTRHLLPQYFEAEELCNELEELIKSRLESLKVCHVLLVPTQENY